MPSADKIEWPQGNPLFEVQWRTVAESLAGNGIVNNGDFEVTATATDMEIQVAAGTAFYIGSNYTLGAAETHVLSDGDANDDRWDTVYFDTGTSSSGVREGTPAANPEPPDISGGELLLAVVYVPSGATNISGTEILNWRAKFSNEAEEIHYDDDSGDYGVNNVEAALDAIDLDFVRGRDNSVSGPFDVSGTTGPIDLGTNPGAYSSIVDAAVDGNDAAGVEESYTFSVDASDLLKIYAESDGAGGIQNAAVKALSNLDFNGQTVEDAGTTLYEPANTWLRNEVVQALANFTADEQFSTYPLVIGTDVNNHLSGNDLLASNGGATIFSQTNGYVPRAQIDIDQTTHTETASGTNTSYTTSSEEYVFVDTATNSSPFTVTLASADVFDGREIRVVDIAGSAATNSITINTEGSETIDGSSSITVSDNYGSAHITSDGTGWKVTGGTAAGTSRKNIVEGTETGAVSNGDQGILIVDELADGDTVRIQKVVLTTATVEAVPSDVDLELVTFDNAGSFTSRTTLASGDGATVYDRVTGSPVGSYTNSSGGAQSVGVLVDNGSGASVSVVAKCTGDII